MRCYSVDENIREYHSPAEAHQPGNGPWQQRVKTRLETNGNIKMKATHSKAFTQPCLRSFDFINWDVSQSVQSAHSSSFNYPSNFWLEVENYLTKFCFQFFLLNNWKMYRSTFKLLSDIWKVLELIVFQSSIQHKRLHLLVTCLPFQYSTPSPDKRWERSIVTPSWWRVEDT